MDNRKQNQTSWAGPGRKERISEPAAVRYWNRPVAPKAGPETPGTQARGWWEAPATSEPEKAREKPGKAEDRGTRPDRREANLGGAGPRLVAAGQPSAGKRSGGRREGGAGRRSEIRLGSRSKTAPKPASLGDGAAARSGPGGGVLALAKGLAVAYLLTCVVFIAFALLLTYTGVPERVIPLVSFVCTAVAAVLAGLCAARTRGQNGLLWGLAAGALYSLVLVGIGLLIGNGFSLHVGRFGTFVLALASGGVGGILGVNR